MINLKSILPIVSLTILLASCHHRNRKHIVISDGNNRTDIKCWGDVQFTADTTAIKSISPGGYVSYAKNGKLLRAERDNNGSVYMEMYDNGKQMALTENTKSFLAEAVKEMTARNVGRIVND
jgi:hypothetical protein